jgi:hypothetical protein
MKASTIESFPKDSMVTGFENLSSQSEILDNDSSVFIEK